MKKLLVTVLLVGFVFLGSAQNIFNLEEVFTSPKMYPKSLRSLQFVEKTNDFIYLKDGDFVRATAPKSETTVWLKYADFSSAIKQASLEQMRGLPTPSYWKDSQSFYFMNQQKLCLYNAKDNTIQVLMSLPEEATNVVLDYPNERAAYVIDNDLFVCLFGQTPKRVNEQQEPEVRYGHVVHRNEFGIAAGSYWSKNGKMLAFYRMDESMVDDYPLVNTTTRTATLKNEKYPMAGLTSHQVTVGIYNVESEKTVYVQTGKPLDQYLTSVSWSPDGKYLFIGVLNREQNHLKMNRYNAQTGAFEKTLFEEQHERYVEPSDPLYFLPNSTTQFLWMSQKSGYKHLHLYNIEGKELKQVTSGKWVVMSFQGFDEKGSKIFITSNKDEICGERLFVVNLANGAVQTICTEEGTHRVSPSKDGKFFLDAYSALHVRACVKLKDAKGKTLATLLDDQESLQEFALPEVSIGSIKNANGDDLYYRLIKPINFDPNKKYPVFFYVYGGPHSQLVTDNWLSGGHFLHYMAQKGYVVFTLDNRGTSNRGFEFESTIHRRLGTVEVEDQMEGVKFLQSLPYVDKNRFSVDGWSYGGFMTTTLKLQHPEVFKVATAGGPVIDWKYYEVMYGERYMDTPQENESGYNKNSLIGQVDKLEGHLMIIHGAIDATVVWQNSLAFLTEAIKQRKQVDYFVYPTHEHNVRGLDRIHLWELIERYHATYNK